MLKWLLIMGAIAFALCGGMSFLMPPPVNPVASRQLGIDARLQVPPGVLAILKRSCYDCHSNETRWPVYSRLWPASALIYSDVSKGRGTMNFSDWPASDDPRHARRNAGLLMAACAAMQSGLMPRKQYLLMHPDARVSPEEAQRFCAWSTTAIESIRKLQH